MIAGAKLHIILFLAKISVKKMSFRTHMWHKTIDYHFSAFGFRACACFNPNRPLGLIGELHPMTFTCQHKTETFVRKTPTSVPGVAISAETHLHFGRNGYLFPRKRKSFCAKRTLPEGSSSIGHQTLIGKRPETTATFPRSTNSTLFYRVQSILYAQKKREGDNHQLRDYRLLTNIISYIQEFTLS